MRAGGRRGAGAAVRVAPWRGLQEQLLRSGLEPRAVEQVMQVALNFDSRLTLVERTVTRLFWLAGAQIALNSCILLKIWFG